MYSYSLCFHNNQHYYSGEYTEYHIASTISHDYNFVIDNGASIHLTAGEEIVLTDGFYAASGADFVAKIEACEPDDGDGMPNLTGIGERNLSGGHAQDGRTRCVPTDNGLVIYPNPAGGTLTVESASPIREITVYDLSGRVMATMVGTGTARHTVNVSSLHSGIYILKALTDSGVETGRFVKN